MTGAAVTVEEWRERNLPHFTATEDEIKRHFTFEIRRVAELLGLEERLFHTSSRIKEAASAARTATRRGMDYWKLPDWIGLRVACPTLEAAYHITLSANGFDGWCSGKRLDYNLEPKIEGYRGIHVYGSVERGAAGGFRVNCEVQVHTRLQALWSELTHDEVYKPDAPVSVLVQDTAANLAAYLAATDQFIERMLKILRRPEDQMRPSESPETRHWIAVIALLDPSLDWFEIEPLVASLKGMGLTRAVQIQRLREDFPRLRETVANEWQAAGLTSPGSVMCLEVVGRLIAQRVGRNDEARKIGEWAREAAEASRPNRTTDMAEERDVQ
jgi:ppGpp synthetase/RelA/SpoT-type nucleotidyltranferase